MMNPGLSLYLVEAVDWKTAENPLLDIGTFCRDALAAERRILQKGVNLANERTRYQLCCRRIQDAVLRMKIGGEKQIRLNGAYFEILRMLMAEKPFETLNARLTACFFPPEQVAAHLEAFGKIVPGQFQDAKCVRQRTEFFQKAVETGCGVVEISEFVSGSSTPVSSGGFGFIQPVSANPCTRFEDDNLMTHQRIELTDLLKNQITGALDNNTGINFSNYPHSVITEALNAFVYRDAPEKPERSLRVLYLDGTEGETFPLYCLERPQKEHPLAIGENNCDNHPGCAPQDNILKASLISMRHLAMDDQVDVAWFRNRKVSAPQPFADTDTYCTQQTMELFNNLSQDGGGLNLYLYQTGLVTAVIGFYRGLVNTLKICRDKGEKSSIRVTPFYYSGRDKSYSKGNIWE
jgi:hypothetical protein